MPQRNIKTIKSKLTLCRAHVLRPMHVVAPRTIYTIYTAPSLNVVRTITLYKQQFTKRNIIFVYLCFISTNRFV